MFTELKKKVQSHINKGISRDDAIKYVVDAVIKTKPVNKEVVEEAVLIAAQQTVSQAFTNHRKVICRRAENIRTLRKQGSENLKEKVAGLMEFRLPSGLVLSKATGSDCAEAANYYLNSSRIQYHRASFLNSLAKTIGDAYVGDVLTEENLQEHYEKARRLS